MFSQKDAIARIVLFFLVYMYWENAIACMYISGNIEVEPKLSHLLSCFISISSFNKKENGGVVLHALVVFVGKAREVAIVLVVQLGNASCQKSRFIKYKHELFNP